MTKLTYQILAVSLLMASLATPAHAFTGLLAGWIDMFNQKVSALKVVTKQQAAAAEKVSTSIRDSTSALATTYIANRQAQITREAAQRFTKQGVFPCFQNDISNQVSETVAKTATAIQGVAVKIQGANYGNESARRADQINLHRAAYCSVSEHKAGLCTVKAMGLQSADADFAFVVKGGTKGSSERNSGYDFIDNILPMRTTAACQSAECHARLSDVRGMNAVDSLARNSLVSMIEARSVQNPN